MTRFLVGFYDIPGFGLDSVETLLEGTPEQQYASLKKQLLDRHPKAEGIIRLGSVIESRAPGQGFIEVFPGMTLAQLFEGDTSQEAESFRTVGRTFMHGKPWDLLVMFRRGAGHVSILAKPLLQGDIPLRFSNQISPQRLVAELPALIGEVLGTEARNTTLRLRVKEVKL